MGRDQQGRSCATSAQFEEGQVGRSRITVFRILILAALLILPVLALRKLGYPAVWVAAYVGAVNLITCLLYARDKHCARAGKWRIPENLLHLLEFAGGWPAAFLAQRWFRHKTSKKSYQLAFWLIVLASQYTAFDALHDWQYSKTALEKLGFS